MRSLLVLLILLAVPSLAQWEIPILTEAQGRMILQEVWPSYAMRSLIVVGYGQDWTPGNPVMVVAPKGTIRFSLLETGGYVVTVNDTMRDTTQYTRWGELKTLTHIFTGDTTRNLLFMPWSIGDTNKASVAWLPLDYLWRIDTRIDSIFAWVAWAVRQAIPDQYVASDTSWKRSERADAMLTQILSLLSTPMSGQSIYEYVRFSPAPLNQISMEPGSIPLSYNSSTQTLTYLRRK